VIYDSGDQEDLIKIIAGEKNLDIKRFAPRAILSTISSAKQEMLDPAKYGSLARGQFQEIVAEVYREYQKRITRFNALDFDDLLFKTVELFQRAPQILEYYQNLFQHIFIDEYQDTNTTQYTFTKLLAKRISN
jgi:DNA helicase-2/ATP-dependent DNA helicase PcrA